jgi:hypothetical protein
MMSDEEQLKLIRRKAIETAKAILEEKIGVIEGSRLMEKLLRQAAIPEDDSDLLSFMGIVSETDDLPVGEVRQHWSAEALKEEDIEIRRCEKLYRQVARKACVQVIERWKRFV